MTRLIDLLSQGSTYWMKNGCIYKIEESSVHSWSFLLNEWTDMGDDFLVIKDFYGEVMHVFEPSIPPEEGSEE